MNKLTPGSNMMWESSRMIIPEHKEAYLRYMDNLKKRTKPVLDQQEMDLISAALTESKHANIPVTVVIFNEYEDIKFTGIVTRIDQQLRRIRLQMGDEWEYVKLDDVVNAYVE